MIGILWSALTFSIGGLFLYIWGKDFKKSLSKHSKKGTFIGSYKFYETLYFILIISIPIWFVNFSGLDGLFYHSKSVLFISSVLVSFSISLVWYLFLNRVDHFEKEPWKTVLFVFILGSVFTFLVFPLSSFVQTNFQFYLNGDLWNDWWYCVFGIGMVEEIVKIIPFFIVLKFTKQVNEPFDYIFYGSISALGFAFIENVLYLNSSNLGSIYGRVLFASVAHMFFTSIITYGLVYFKHVKFDLKGFEFPILLLVASFAHGFYDFWLINETASNFYYLTTIFYLLSIYFWARMINNSLNISPFYNLREQFRSSRLKYRIVNLLITTFYFAYVAVFLLSDKVSANKLLLNSWQVNIFVLLFLAFNLSDIKLLKGYVGKVRFKNKFAFLVPGIHSHKSYAGKEVRLFFRDGLRMRKGKEALRPLFPVDAKLERRISIKGDSDCYFIKTERPLNIRHLVPQYFILKLISKEEELLSSKPNPMVLYGLRTYPDFKNGIIPDKDVVFLHELEGVEIT